MNEDLKQSLAEQTHERPTYYLEFMTESDREFLEKELPPESTEVMIFVVVQSAYLEARNDADMTKDQVGVVIEEFRQNQANPEWWHSQEAAVPGLAGAVRDATHMYVEACKKALPQKSAA